MYPWLEKPCKLEGTVNTMLCTPRKAGSAPDVGELKIATVVDSTMIMIDFDVGYGDVVAGEVFARVSILGEKDDMWSIVMWGLESLSNFERSPRVQSPEPR
jgi:hypothetical protein